MSSDKKKMKAESNAAVKHVMEEPVVKEIDALVEDSENMKNVQGLEDGEAAPLSGTDMVLKDASKAVADPASEDKDKPNKDADATPAVTLTDLEKKQKRAERFGTELKISETEKRNMRAARFHGGKNNAAKQESPVTPPKGTPPKGAAGVKAPSKDVAEAEVVKRRARAQRFGALPADVPASAPLSTGEEAKKKARLERFAMAAK